MRCRAAVLVAFLLTGCVTTTKRVMNEWVGRDESSLVSAWGAPNLRADLPNGGLVLTWLKSYDSGPSGSNSGTCRRSFTLSPARVVTSWSTDGCPSVVKQ
jgi:hypothetical protein